MRITKDRETIKQPHGNFMVVQWLRLLTSTAGAATSIPCQGTKISHALWPTQTLKKKNKQKKNSLTRK